MGEKNVTSGVLVRIMKRNHLYKRICRNWLVASFIRLGICFYNAHLRCIFTYSGPYFRPRSLRLFLREAKHLKPATSRFQHARGQAPLLHCSSGNWLSSLEDWKAWFKKQKSDFEN